MPRNAEKASAGSRITQTHSAGSHSSCTTVSAGSKKSRIVEEEAKYDGQSRQVVKIDGLVYTLCSLGLGDNSFRKEV